MTTLSPAPLPATDIRFFQQQGYSAGERRHRLVIFVIMLASRWHKQAAPKLRPELAAAAAHFKELASKPRPTDQLARRTGKSGLRLRGPG